jgi:alcohol dehydrogenase (cytochrome c)
VFTTTAEGALHALNDETLEPLWSAELAALAPVPPITFAVDGEQFVAVVVGGNRFSDELSFRPPGADISKDLFVVVVYGLPS